MSAGANTSPWTLRLQLALAALGLGPLLLVLGALAVGLLWFVALPAAEAGREAAGAAWRAAQQAGPGHRQAIPTAPQADALAEFTAHLADDEDVARLAQRIWHEAGVAGLQLSKVDWRAEADAGQRFGRLHITVPMTGPYTAMRKFSFGLLAAYPGLALDRLDMKREQLASTAVETTAHFTLYVRP